MISKYICNWGNAKYNHEETLFHIHPIGKISSMTIVCVGDDAEQEEFIKLLFSNTVTLKNNLAISN